MSHVKETKLYILNIFTDKNLKTNKKACSYQKSMVKSEINNNIIIFNEDYKKLSITQNTL